MKNKTNQTSNQTMNQSKNRSMADQKRTMRDKVGNAIEKLGHKISKAGAPGLGQKIHDVGDKMETHHRNPNHPHKA